MSRKTKTTTPMEEAMPALVPKLRFPEFRDAVGWEISELGSLSDVRDGTHDSPEFFTTGWPLVTSKNLRPDGTLDLENVSLISEEDYVQINKRSKVSVGDILFGMIGTIGNPVLLKSEGFAIKNVALIKEMKSLSNIFVIQLLQTEYVAAIFAVLNTGNSQKFIALGKIRGLLVPVPSPAEQQKIAECLSSLDELMAAQARKVDALKTHKKGLMQQLFPREGETQPRLRFPEFQNVGEWGRLTLGDVGDFKNGVNFSAEKKGRGILTVDVLNMYGMGIEMKLEGLYRVDVEAGDYLLSGGDILFVRSSMKREGVGWASLFRGCSEPVIFCGFLIRLRPKSFKSTDSEFLSQYLRSAYGRSKIISVSGTAAITNISQDSLKEVTFPFPALPEQQRIATCLSSLDALITAETQKHEALKTHKKGLMQQLFPSPEEVEA